MAEASVWISNVACHVENVNHRLASNHSQVSTGWVNIIISLQSEHPKRFSSLCADHYLSSDFFFFFSMEVVFLYHTLTTKRAVKMQL